MTFTPSKTEFFRSNNPIQIKFSEIRDTFGGNPANIRASEYKRNTDLNVKWDDVDNIPVPRIPDATENANVSTDNNLSIDSLRNTITEYTVTQEGVISDNPTFNDSNITVWGGNLNKNVLKKFNIEGTIGSTKPSLPALTLDGNLVNLDVTIEEDGNVYGAGGAAPGGNGGSALYINNTYTQSDVDVRVFGKVWAGGGGGFNGNPGNTGPSLSCSSTINFNTTNNEGIITQHLVEAAPGRTCRRVRSGAIWAAATPIATRNRCRGSGARASEGTASWSNFRRMSGNYQCSGRWFITCQQTISNPLGGGPGGGGGTGGPGRGFDNQNIPLVGNPGNPGGTNSCSGGTSRGNPGNPGQGGGDWGSASAGQGGIALFKKNVKLRHYTTNSFKGRQTDI